jgi:hypothetical protein
MRIGACICGNCGERTPLDHDPSVPFGAGPGVYTLVILLPAQVERAYQ